MKQFTLGTLVDVRVLQSPRLYVRVWRIVFMWWPHDKGWKKFSLFIEEKR